MKVPWHLLMHSRFDFTVDVCIHIGVFQAYVSAFLGDNNPGPHF